MLFTDTEITANSNSHILYYYYFPYSDSHATYPLESSITSSLMKVPGADCVISFLSLKIIPVTPTKN